MRAPAHSVASIHHVAIKNAARCTALPRRPIGHEAIRPAGGPVAIRAAHRLAHLQCCGAVLAAGGRGLVAGGGGLLERHVAVGLADDLHALVACSISRLQGPWSPAAGSCGTTTTTTT
eukprot:CAMPEP_0174347828 /NCGR_PEP_ID=MMETSP0811_2-20130205/4057_1 /TAXON_ID=73025 ORGANISM="Eutreptiella gymnastica-like, Strain CCMP1594" /NCGR_SAMPLE_ID=MMETSP0811_2 /ASSEMBLY_ACC=CAM_ASM_000667 /LENGTH=117 /DNA_ID=CAMNT_0015473787 /DNA_START=1280 /DNA_END=1630 /DNA_ORIENTATION=+